MLAVLLGPAAALAYLPAPYGGVVTAPLPDLPVSLDPAEAHRESELQIASLLYDTLYRLDPAGRPQPHLVEPGVTRSTDGKVWTLRLRRGVTLHNGQVLSATQVALSLNRARRSGQGHLLAVVQAVAAEGDQLVLQLRRPSPELPWLLCAPATAIAVSHDGRWIGSGPFRLKGRSGSGVDVIAHRMYFAGRPYLDQIRFKVFERPSAEVASFQVGTLQLSFHGTSVFGSQPRHAFATAEVPPMTLVYLAVSRARPYMSDRRFRTALLKGIDRSRLGRLAATGQHEVAASPVCRRLLKTRLSTVAFDRSDANRLLGQLANRYPQLTSDAASGRLRLSLLVDESRVEDRIVAGQLVADLDRIGIAVTIDAQPATLYNQRLHAGRYDIALARVAPQVPRGAPALAGVLAVAGQRDAATRCASSRRCGEREARKLMQELPLVPLVHTSARVAYDARLGQLRLEGGGLVRYADIYLRKAP